MRRAQRDGAPAAKAGRPLRERRKKMKKLCYKKWVKACAAVLCLLAFNLMLASLAAMGIAQAAGMYGEKSQEEIRKEAFEKISMNYSVWAVSQYRNDFGTEDLKDTNFRYGVIRSDGIDGLDLNDRSVYEACNFDKEVTRDMLEIHSFNMGESTDVYVGTSLFDSFYVQNRWSEQEQRNMAEKCYYARDRQQFYLLSGGKFYPAQPNNISEYYAGEIIKPVKAEGDGESGARDGFEQYEWNEADWDQAESPSVEFDGLRWYLSDIPIVLQNDLFQMGDVVSEYEQDDSFEEYAVRDGCIVTWTTEIKDTEPYYVLSYVNSPLEDEDGFLGASLYEKLGRFGQQDFYLQADALIQEAFAVRGSLFGIFAVSLLLFSLSFFVLMKGAGHHGSDAVQPGWPDRIPFDVFCFAAFWIVLFSCGACALLASAGSYLGAQFGILFLLAAEALLLSFCASFAVRIKTGGLLKNTLVFKLWRLLSGRARVCLQKAGEAVPLLWRAAAVLAALALIEIVGISATAYEPGWQVFLWLIEKIVLYAFLIKCLLQMKKLQQAGEALAAGEMEGRVDTERMFLDFKRHGENLNNIREGIRHAVAEQMKSERFKTELITNVSHDIKTPLTSIINYVDLLEKEDIENPNAREYLEVLSRQSARLKKLIEDLLEASKASTGNLSVELERCDAGVMLTQTIGEFEEKLKAGQIDLLVKGGDAPFFIQADPRHLWRIFDNLMNNICKYAQPSTRAYVNIERTADAGKIIFRNTSKYALNVSSEELTERFVRGDSSRNTEGSGLGLSIANSLAELMGGTFTLVVDGDLFKVVLEFPAVEEEKERERRFF